MFLSDRQVRAEVTVYEKGLLWLDEAVSDTDLHTAHRVSHNSFVKVGKKVLMALMQILESYINRR